MKKILVTGSAGFIGFHTVVRLIKEGYKVMGIDDMNNHYDPLLKQKRLDFLKSHYKDSFQFQKLDIRNKKKIKNLLKKETYHAVINLAARPGVRASIINPWVYFETNTIGVLNLMEGIKTYQPKTLLIQASTSSVYGDNKVPFNEDDRVDHPLSPYASSKKASEELCFTYHYLYNINVMVFRFFTVYGPYGRPDMGVFRFIKWIDQYEELRLYGDGNQKRDFTYVGDITEAIIKALDFKGYQIINLGNDSPVSINKLINQIEKLLDKRAKIKYLPRHPADLLDTCAKIEKAKRILKWYPKIKIDEGIKLVVDWYKNEEKWVKNIRVD